MEDCPAAVSAQMAQQLMDMYVGPSSSGSIVLDRPASDADVQIRALDEATARELRDSARQSERMLRVEGEPVRNEPPERWLRFVGEPVKNQMSSEDLWLQVVGEPIRNHPEQLADARRALEQDAAAAQKELEQEAAARQKRRLQDPAPAAGSQQAGRAAGTEPLPEAAPPEAARPVDDLTPTAPPCEDLDAQMQWEVEQLDAAFERSHRVRWADEVPGGELVEFEPDRPPPGVPAGHAALHRWMSGLTGPQAADFAHQTAGQFRPPPPPPPPPARRLLTVMRHSVRVDADPGAEWAEKSTRPYDSPISDFDLPVQQAKLLREKGLGSYDLIVCSPFMRCLQTAAVVARELGISRVRVNKALGEKMANVRRDSERVWAGSRPADGKISYLSPAAELAVLSSCSGGVVKAIDRAPGGAVNSGVIRAPPPDEDHAAGKRRYVEELCRLRDRTIGQEGLSVLVVAHGDTVDGAMQAFSNQTCYLTEECCWVSFQFDAGLKPTRRGSNRLEAMVMY